MAALVVYQSKQKLNETQVNLYSNVANVFWKCNKQQGMKFVSLE